MLISTDNLFGVNEKALQVQARRAELLASNLANADTPGYKARDLDFKAVMQQVEQPAKGIKVTHARHMTGGATDNRVMPALYRVPHQPSLDGNTVDVQAEQSRFTQNAMAYSASIQFINGRISSIISALKGE